MLKIKSGIINMIAYAAANKELDLYVPPVIRSIIMDFLEDPVKKWQKNKYKDVLKDLNFNGVINSQPNIEDIQLMHAINYRYAVQEAFEESVAVQIKNRCVKYCKGCKMALWLEEFGPYKSCNSCRYKGRLRTYVKKIHLRLRRFLNQIAWSAALTHNAKIKCSAEFFTSQIVRDWIKKSLTDLLQSCFYHYYEDNHMVLCYNPKL